MMGFIALLVIGLITFFILITLLEDILISLITTIVIVIIEIYAVSWIDKKMEAWEKEREQHLKEMVAYINDNKVLSEDGKVFSIWNCETMKKTGEGERD